MDKEEDCFMDLSRNIKSQLNCIDKFLKSIDAPAFLFPHVMAFYCGGLAKLRCVDNEEQALQGLFDSMQTGYEHADLECTCNKESE